MEECREVVRAPVRWPPQSRRRHRHLWEVELSSRRWEGLEEMLASARGSEVQVMRG